MKDMIGTILLWMGLGGILILHETIIIAVTCVLFEGVQKVHRDRLFIFVMFIFHCPLILLIGVTLLS